MLIALFICICNWDIIPAEMLFVPGSGSPYTGFDM